MNLFAHSVKVHAPFEEQANLDEQIEPFLGGEIGLVAVVRDLDPPDQFHYEERPANSPARLLLFPHVACPFIPSHEALHFH
jgi:hypothetical protein